MLSERLSVLQREVGQLLGCEVRLSAVNRGVLVVIGAKHRGHVDAKC